MVGSRAFRRSVRVALCGASIAAFSTCLPARARAAPKDCSALEKKQRASNKLDVLVALAQCHQAAGKLVRARAEYQDAIARAKAAKNKAVLKAAERGLKETEAKLAWVSISAEPDAGVTDIRVDGQTVAAGANVPLEPGPHTITATGPSRLSFSKKLALRSGDSEQVVIPADKGHASVGGGDAPPTSPAPAPSAPPEESASSKPDPSDAHASAPSHDGAHDEDEPEPHTGFVADLEALLQMYTQAPQPGAEAESGEAVVTVATVGYDFTPQLRAYVRYGLVHNAPPALSTAQSLSNLGLGGRFSLSPIPRLSVGAEAGLILPFGSGGGDAPSQDLVFANVRARALHPALFDPNYLTPWLGVDAGTTIEHVTLRLGVAVEQSIRTAGSGFSADASKTRLRLTPHVGYQVLPWLEPFVELRWFRFLSTPVFVEADPPTGDSLFGALGVAFAFAPTLPLRARLTYLRAIDEPLTRDDFHVLSLQLGVDF